MADNIKKPKTTVAFGEEIKEATLADNIKKPKTTVAFGEEIKEATLADNIKKPKTTVGFGEEIKEATLADNIKKPKTTVAFGEEIKEATLANKLIVIFFSANWSGKCEYMMDVIEREMAVTHDDVVFIVIDIDVMPELMINWYVDCVPTFVLMKQERLVDKRIGFYPNELEEVIGILKTRTVYERAGLYRPWPV